MNEVDPSPTSPAMKTNDNSLPLQASLVITLRGATAATAWAHLAAVSVKYWQSLICHLPNRMKADLTGCSQLSRNRIKMQIVMLVLFFPGSVFVRSSGSEGCPKIFRVVCLFFARLETW